MSPAEERTPPYRISLSLPTPSSSPDAPPTSSQHLGTVLYSGPIPPTSGTWLGVEWDDPTRGKHDGGYKPTGVRYFRPRVTGAGSFIRPTAKGLSYGRSFGTALRDKYLGEGALSPSSAQLINSEPAALAAQEGSTLYATNSNFEVEVPSLERIKSLFKQLDRLREVGLEWEGVASAGGAEELEQLGAQLTKLRTVNLSFSLLATLAEADAIASSLSALTTLYLNSNRFAPIFSPTLLPGFARLTTLCLNSTLVSWAEVLNISSSLKGLRHLELGYNRLESLASPAGWDEEEGEEKVLPALEELNLEGNALSSWAKVESSLGGIPSLKRLILANNRFSSLTSSANPRTSPPSARKFTALRHLSLASNLLSTWSALDPLNDLPALESLRLAENPILAGETEERGGLTRLRVIGRVGRIKELEGSIIHPPERDDAERFYLAEIAKDDTLKTDQERAKAHPRYTHLVQQHGTISQPEPKQNLRSRLIKLNVEFPPSLPLKPTLAPNLSVLPSLKTMLLRSHLAKLCGKPVPKTKYRLIAVLAPAKAEGLAEERGGDGDPGQALEILIEVSEEGRELSWWGLQEGDTVRVVEL